jgi:hypothetical protein
MRRIIILGIATWGRWPHRGRYAVACFGVLLDGSAEEAQVWRLDADGTTKAQVTRSSGRMISPSHADGSLAFVSGNQLFLQTERARPAGFRGRPRWDGTTMITYSEAR